MRSIQLATFALAVLTACSCRQGSSSAPGDSAPVASSAPSASCEPLANNPAQDWAERSLPFGSVRCPSSWILTPGQGGFEFRDPARRRRVFFSEVVFPASAQLSPEQAMDRVLQRVRAGIGRAGLSVDLGPVRHAAGPEQPSASFLSRTRDVSIYSAITARKVNDSGVRLVSATYEEDTPGITPDCIDAHGAALIGRVVVSAAPVGEGSGPAAASVVRFAPAAKAQLARLLQPGDTVWLGAVQSGNDVSFQIELRTPDDVPADALRDRVDGLPIALHRSSFPLLDGATVDYSSEGGGFVFSQSGGH